MQIEPINSNQELQGIARVLHNVFLSYPSEEMIHTFVEDRLDESWPQLAGSENNRQGKVLLQAFFSQWKPEQLTELKLDYGQLFFGPGEPTAMPWGSVYVGEQQLLNDKSTLELMAFYKQHEISFKLDYHQPLDHIGLFYGVIDQLLGMLLLEPENQQAKETLVVLLQRHMLPWSGRCLQLAKTHATTDFYKGIALLAEDFEAVLSNQFKLVPMSMRLFR
ncbi:molecular chaperone TorD family protein [Shewanella sp. D64]|uniref:TorD/DmsD family molecular chaperone n=1 Tax=unclassified Shewanella TaxID=196818 RepID=UPI0022BA12C3|nr:MULTISPECIES: molecular chaperone TorD family protein [unclassified Shewanella]MEC4728737.1 molecular chaperone TorD family protein [Shewanella sp. D64]MEC4740606.1 molecular chaperone TorD family protein [Shewanella sp. E94]WBJ95121.1 molecular chaperone TorD family protein [Shewanella sp. MTB7]